MAEVIAYDVLNGVLQKLASEAVKKIVRSLGIQSDLKKLERTLFHFQNLLNDASKKELTNLTDVSVRQWLNNLSHLAYDLDDILDDLATEAMHREFNENESISFISKVKRLIPSWFTPLLLKDSTSHKFYNITTQLHDLEKEKNALGLVVKDDRPINLHKRLQTSLVDESRIIGRQVQKEELVHKLLADEPCDGNFSIVPIVGMGGVGKTTLARLLYNDKKVKDHFEVKVWVCVSDDFDLLSISKDIFKSVSGENNDNLNMLRVHLRYQLMGKRFLLVLDDVWSESYEDWETLVDPFHACAPGSRIIMTTRKEQLLKKLGYNHIDHLHSLSHDDAMTLFAQNALSLPNFDSHPTLKPYGEGIVKKCGGLPLALKALGRLLRTKVNEEVYWKDVLNSDIWRLKDGGGIVPALRLSYHDLSARLKRLFAYHYKKNDL